jgi:hypothetical protein
MVFAKLVEFIEDHWEPISNRVLQRMQSDNKLPHIRQITHGDLEDMGQRLVKNLSHWLMESHHEEIGHKYEELARLRFRDAIPLHELMWSVLLVKKCVVDYVREQGLAQSTVDIYAEEELEHRLDEFFDDICFHIVKGYEAELRKAAHLTAVA